jgi:hypothetical protein
MQAIWRRYFSDKTRDLQHCCCSREYPPASVCDRSEYYDPAFLKHMERLASDMERGP